GGVPLRQHAVARAPDGARSRRADRLLRGHEDAEARPAKDAMTPGVQGALLALDVQRIDTVHGRFRAHRFHNLTTSQPALAVAIGSLGGRAPLLARVHSSCVTSEVYGACDCDCAEH